VLAGNSVAVGYPNLNGQVIWNKNYNSEGKIVQFIENQDIYHPISLINAIAYGVNPNDPNGFAYLAKYQIETTFNTPYITKTTVSSTPSSITEAANEDAPAIGNSIQTTTNFTYNTTGTNPTYLLKSQHTVDSKNQITLKEIKRPSDYSSPSPALNVMNDTNVNWIEPVIEEITRKDGKVVSATGNRYELENGTINLKAVYGYNNASGFVGSTDGSFFGNGYELQEEFTQYDPITKKLLQYIDRSGVVNSFVWGYNNKLPIVHGIGISSSLLNTAFVSAQASGAIGSDAYETVLRNHANTAGKQITTYMHNPLVGVSRVTSPTGQKKSFQYDNYARLQKILDKDGLTIEQYKYHFKERPQTRVMSLSGTKLVLGNLNFGTLTPDMFASQFLFYERCTDKLRSNVLTITNDGEDDLTVYSMTFPTGFSTVWRGATNHTVIPAGTSVDVIVNFNGETLLPSGIYTGTISIASDKTAGLSEITITANYVNRNPSVSFSPVIGTNPAIFDFGRATGILAGRYIDITNNGNAAFRIDGLPMGWNGTSPDYTSFTNPDFSTSYSFGQTYPGGRTYSQCISVGETVRIPMTFNPTPGGPNGIRSAKLSLITDIPNSFWPSTLYKDAVTLQADLQRPISTITMDTSPVDFGTFTEVSKNKTITISNNSTLGFTVNGISVADGSVASWFTLSPSTWTLYPGTTKDFVLTFQPAVKDVTANTNITINNDAMYGNESFSVTGRRYSLRTIQLTPNSLTFDYTGQTLPVNVANSSASNENLYISGVSYPNTPNWSASITPTTLAPGQSTSLSITRTTGANEPLSFTVNSSKNSGNEIVTVGANTRIIGISPGSLAFPPFSGPSISQDVTISNTSGNSTLSVTDVSSTNGTFTVSPTSLSIPAGGQQNVTVTFTPGSFDFNPQNGTLSFNSNKTSGNNTLNVSGQRTALRTIQLSTNSLTFDYTGQTQYVTVSNGGNDNLYINGVSYPSTPNWSASITPTTLAPGQSTSLSITRTTGANEPLSFTVNSSKNNGNEIVTVGANTRVIAISPISLVFSAFSSASISQDVTIGNASGNTPLSVNNVTSTNGAFTVSPTSLSIPAGGQQNVTITFTPGSYDFTPQSGTLTFNANQTSGNNTLNVSGQRTALRTIQLSTNSLTFDYTGQTQYVTVSNGGNDNLYISGVSYPSTPNWSASITPTTLAPGQSSSLAITKTTGTNEPINFTVNSSKNGGNEVVQAIYNVPPSRIISISPVSFSSFTGTSTTSNMTISNNGNATLNINSIISSNPKFTFSMTSFSIPAGGQQTVVVTFSSSAFENESANFTVGSDASSGSNTASTSAQRTQLAQLSVSPTSLPTLRFGSPVQSCYVTNTGNVNATINSIGNNSPSNFGVTYYSGGFPVTVPFTLTPGAQFEIQVRTVGSNYSSANGQLYIHNSVTSFYTIYLSRATF
jgi:hypothetical protein